MDAGLVAHFEREWRCSTSEERRFSYKKKAPVMGAFFVKK